jgi:hypothetical protein
METDFGTIEATLYYNRHRPSPRPPRPVATEVRKMKSSQTLLGVIVEYAVLFPFVDLKYASYYSIVVEGPGGCASIILSATCLC